MAAKYRSWDRNNPEVQKAVRFTPYYKLLLKKTPEVIEVMELTPPVWAHLKRYEVVTSEKYQEIQVFPANNHMVAKLLEHLEKSAVWKFHALVRALQVSGQDHVVRLLDLEPEQYAIDSEDENTMKINATERRNDSNEGDDEQPAQTNIDCTEKGVVPKFHGPVEALQVSGEDHVVRILDLEPEQDANNSEDENTFATEGRDNSNEGDGEQPAQTNIDCTEKSVVLKFHAPVETPLVSGEDHVVRLLDLEAEQDTNNSEDETTSLMDGRHDSDEGDHKESVQMMDLVENLQPCSEEEKSANQPKTPKAYYSSQEVYLFPYVHEEIPDTEYETPHNPNTTSPLSPESEPALLCVKQPASYCRESPRFWCLLTAALTSVIIIPLIIVIVLFTPGTPNTAGPSAVPTDSENAGKTTSSTYGAETSEAPKTTETSESLTNATFLMNCERLSEDKTSVMYGLCWMDEETLIVTSRNSQRVLKYTVNTEAKSCHGEVIDSGYRAWDPSCSADGSVYITEYQGSGDQVKIRIFDVQNKSSQVWYPRFSTETGRVNIAVNDKFIVISVDSDNYVYNKDRVLQYKIHHTEVGLHFMRTYLTTDNVFIGTVYGGYKLLVLNLLTNETSISNDEVKNAYAVTGTRGGHVFVTRYNPTRMGRDVGMYSLHGTFLNYIQIELPRFTLYGSAAVRNNNGKTIIAYTGGRSDPIWIYYVYG